MAEIPIDIGFYESSTLPLAAQNCINHYPQNPQTKGAVSAGALFSTPGILDLLRLGSSPGRGFNIFKNELYVLVGETFYKIKSNNHLVVIGTIPGTERVIASNNGVTICIQIPGGDGYFYDLDNGLKKISNAVYSEYQTRVGGVTSVTYKDGYFVFTTAIEFFISSLVTQNKGQNFDALDFGTAEVKPDDNVIVATIKNELFVAGTDTIELFQNTGGSGFPFQRINGATIDKGVLARLTFIEFDNSFVFIGGGINESIGVWRGLSGSASKISTSAIDHALQQYTLDEISNSFAWTYTEDGNFFVGFSLPDTAYVYDATTSAIQGRPVWHERQSNNIVWRANHTIDAYSKVYVLDSIDGRVGLLNRNYTDEYTEDITRMFTGAYLYNQGKSFKIPYLELRTESGIGNIKGSASGTNPQVELLMSIDDGRTFQSFGNKPLGTYQNYKQRQVWKRLGRTEHTALSRFVTTGNTTSNYTNLNVNIVGGY